MTQPELVPVSPKPGNRVGWVAMPESTTIIPHRIRRGGIGDTCVKSRESVNQETH